MKSRHCIVLEMHLAYEHICSIHAKEKYPFRAYDVVAAGVIRQSVLLITSASLDMLANFLEFNHSPQILHHSYPVSETSSLRNSDAVIQYQHHIYFFVEIPIKIVTVD
jgi:hypothetical protein